MIRRIILLTIALALVLTFALPVAMSNDTQVADDGGVAIASLIDFSDNYIAADPTCPPNSQGNDC